MKKSPARRAMAPSDQGKRQTRSDTWDKQLATIGRLIREQRLRKGLSQERLAAAANLGRAYFGALERGEVAFSVITAMKIASALEVEVATLFPAMNEFAEDSQEAKSNGETRDNPRLGLKPGVKPLLGVRAGETVIRGEAAESQGEQVSGSKVEENKGRSTLVGTGVAARMTGVNRRTIGRWVKSGVLRAELVESSEGRLTAVFKRDDIVRVAKRIQRERES